MCSRDTPLLPHLLSLRFDIAAIDGAKAVDTCRILLTLPGPNLKTFGFYAEGYDGSFSDYNSALIGLEAIARILPNRCLGLTSLTLLSGVQTVLADLQMSDVEREKLRLAQGAVLRSLHNVTNLMISNVARHVTSLQKPTHLCLPSYWNEPRSGLADSLTLPNLTRRRIPTIPLPNLECLDLPCRILGPICTSLGKLGPTPSLKILTVRIDAQDD